METIKELGMLFFVLNYRNIRDFAINNEIGFRTSKNFTDKDAILINHMLQYPKMYNKL